MDPIYLIYIFIILTLLGMPIAFVLGFVGVLSIFILGSVPLSTIPQMMWISVDSFPLLALPFFILAGDVMNSSGITKSLVKLSKLIVGRLKGGLSYTVVIASTLFASLSGSATATAAAVGSTVVPEMEKEGYDKSYSAALTAVSSVLGPIIPPSTAAVILGVTASLSIGSLFVAGIIPGIIVALALITLVRFNAVKYNFPQVKITPTKNEIKLILKDSVPALIMPLIILGGILGGVFTATEAAGVACLYGILIGFFYTKTFKRFKDLSPMFIRAGILTGTINFILSTSNVVGWTLSVYQIPQLVTAWFTGLTDNPLIILLLINLLLILAGMFIETMVSIVILTPILFPLITSLGIDPLHFGIIMLVNLSIGIITPPLGLSLFVMSSVVEIETGVIVRRAMPMIAVTLIALLLITYVPILSTGLPKLLELY